MNGSFFVSTRDNGSYVPWAGKPKIGSAHFKTPGGKNRRQSLSKWFLKFSLLLIFTHVHTLPLCITSHMLLIFESRVTSEAAKPRENVKHFGCWSTYGKNSVLNE